MLSKHIRASIITKHPSSFKLQREKISDQTSNMSNAIIDRTNIDLLIDHYNNSVQNLEDAIHSADRIHNPVVLAAREAVINASSDTWDLKQDNSVYKHPTIFNESLQSVNVDNYMVMYSKKDIIINTVEELKRKLVNNDILDTSYRLAHDSRDDAYEITIKVSNNIFAIQCDAYHYHKKFQISKNNLLYILNKLIKLYYSRN
jgi:hypothetical protein